MGSPTTRQHLHDARIRCCGPRTLWALAPISAHCGEKAFRSASHFAGDMSVRLNAGCWWAARRTPSDSRGRDGARGERALVLWCLRGDAEPKHQCTVHSQHRIVRQTAEGLRNPISTNRSQLVYHDLRHRAEAVGDCWLDRHSKQWSIDDAAGDRGNRETWVLVEEVRLNDQSRPWFTVVPLKCDHHEVASFHEVQPSVSPLASIQSMVSFSRRFFAAAAALCR